MDIFLKDTKLPSVLSFITILKYIYDEDALAVYLLLSRLNKRGKLFYFKHFSKYDGAQDQSREVRPDGKIWINGFYGLFDVKLRQP